MAQAPVRVRCAGAPAGIIPSIDSTQLMADILALADDSMQGRQVGTPGGARARAYVLRRFRALGLDTLRTGALEVFPAPAGASGIAANIVAFVPGRTRPGRVILVTAHYDHLGARNGEVFNGADDNASGTAAMLALAGWFRAHPPQHTIVFIALDGEEDGLLGATAFVRAGLVPRDSMVIDVNLDMVSRSAKRQLFAVGPKRYPALVPYLATTACSAGVALMLGHDKGSSGRDDWTMESDQGAFFQAGVPFTYFGVEDHADYHEPTDDVARIDPGFFTAATRAIATFVSLLDGAP